MSLKQHKTLKILAIPILCICFLLASLSTASAQVTEFDQTNTFSFIFICFLIVIDIILVLKPIPLINFAVGITSILIALSVSGDATMPFQPYFSIMGFGVALVSFISAVIKVQGGD